MNRILLFVALPSLLLTTAVLAYTGHTPDTESYRASTQQQPTLVSRLMSSTNATSLQGDNCGVDGYPWLSADGQPVES